MAKIALAIGVSEYESGLTPLPGSARDVEAMRRVLQHPDMGGFDDVKTLSNPARQEMQEAIETLFSGRAKGDLVLLFFSGHGVKDDNGKLHLATRTTRKTPQGELRRSTVVESSWVQDIMSNSMSKRQVVILDCCFSGAFAEGWSAKDDGSVDVKSQLGGEGRAVLTSSTSTQYSFEQEGADLSTYTRYLVEGIETGAADLDSDGVVSIDELHEYAKGKVQETAPAMKPEIYAVKEGYKIRLAQAPTEDPKLRYRKEVEHCASHGAISAVCRHTLDALRDGLGLLHEDATAIEDEVLKPYQEYRKKLQRYEQALVEAIEREHSLNDNTQNELKRLQRVLKLTDEDIAQIETQVTSQKKVSQAEAPTPKIRLPRMSAISVPVLRNPKLLIGTGVVTAGALTFINFMVKTPQPEQNVEPTATASPSVSAYQKSTTHNGNGYSYPQTSTTYNGNGYSYPQMSAQDFVKKGLDKFYQKEYEGAIADFDQAIKLNPDYADSFYNRGLAKHNLRDEQGALADYYEAAELYQKQGKIEDSKDALEQVNKLQ